MLLGCSQFLLYSDILLVHDDVIYSADIHDLVSVIASAQMLHLVLLQSMDDQIRLYPGRFHDSSVIQNDDKGKEIKSTRKIGSPLPPSIFFLKLLLFVCFT